MVISCIHRVYRGSGNLPGLKEESDALEALLQSQVVIQSD